MSKICFSIEIVISTTKSLSSMSLASRREIQRILSRKYSDVRITDVNTRADLDQVIARRPDLVFLGMKFIPNDTDGGASKIWLNEELSKARIVFTGSEQLASKMEHFKHLAKEAVLKHGLKTADSQLISHGENLIQEDILISYPIFVKPESGGGGSGINESSLVHTFDELRKQIAWLSSASKTDILLESYLPGREFSVGLLRKRGINGFHLMALEIVAPKNLTGARFLSSKIKQADTEQTMEVTDRLLKMKINDLALKVFNTLGARDYGRIDIRLDANNVPHFLEANLLPSLLNNYGNLPKATMLNIGMSHERLILEIVELALSNNTRRTVPIIRPITRIINSGLQKPTLQPVG